MSFKIVWENIPIERIQIEIRIERTSDMSIPINLIKKKKKNKKKKKKKKKKEKKKKK